MKHLFLLTSIFLWAAFSASAQTADELRMRAVELERIYFSSTDPVAAESALLDKAGCLLALGDSTEALSTLNRIQMYALPAEKRASAESMAVRLQPSADTSRAKKVSPVWAFLPPVGHFVNGEYGRGILMTALDLGSIAFGVWQIVSGNWITGYLVGAVGLDIFYYNEAVRLVPRISESD